MSAPIFIVGANRSGTTLLRLILNAHSRIAIPEELRYFHARTGGAPIEDWAVPGLSEHRFTRLVDRYAQRAQRIMPGIDADAVRKRILRQPARDLRAPYAALLSTWAESEGKARWGEKTPGNLFYADVLIEMFPKAQFLYITRDPRAGVNSMLNADFFTDDTVFNALTRRNSATNGRAILTEHVPPEQRHDLRFEDLVRDPETTVERICAFLNEPFEPSMLEFYRDAPRYMKSEAAQDFNARATRPISEDSADRWRDSLAAHDVAIVEHICSGEMEAAGYTPDNVSLTMGQRAEIAVKESYWAWQRWRHRDIRHYYVNYRLFARSRHRLRNAASHLGLQLASAAK